MASGTPTGEMDKSSADACLSGFTVSIRSEADIGDAQPETVAGSIAEFVQMVWSENDLDLSSLRLVLATPNLHAAVGYWEQALGLPMMGLSSQPEGVVVGKHMSWGHTKETARSIVIIPSYIAAAVTLCNEMALSTLAHELGHVHDDYARGNALGFQSTKKTPTLGNWPDLCASLAENTWSEYAAEIVGARYINAEYAQSLLQNDADHLLGVHSRIKKGIADHRARNSDFSDLWSRSVTDIFDAFANLGRAAARLRYEENIVDALAGLVKPESLSAPWKPIVGDLFLELQMLHEKPYVEWPSDPFSELRRIVAAGFNATGFLPKWNGALSVNLI